MAENGRRKRLDELVIALAAGHTVREAAERAGIGERTAHRRLGDAAFRKQLTEARAQIVERALSKLADGSAEAVDTLRNLLTAGTDTVKLGAARSILELGTRLREHVELAERLSVLEQRVAERLPG